MKRKLILIFFLIIPLLIISLFFTRLFNPKEIDDVSQEIPCERDYLEKSDIFWVIPKFNNKPISEDKEWCNYILSLNKTIGMHGVTHEYQEFLQDRNQEYLNQGIKIFEDCFGFQPKMFKPPQLKISEENKRLIKENNIELKINLNQILHKVYHCNSTEKFSNRFIDIF